MNVKDDDLKEAAAELSSGSGEVMTALCDVSDPSAVNALRDKVLDRFGKVHVLMNNAGIGRMGTKPWEDLDAFNSLLDESVKMVAVNHVSNALGTVNPVETIIEKAHAAAPDSASIRYHLGTALALAGDSDRAREMLQSAVDAANFDEIDAAKAELAKLEP